MPRRRLRPWMMVSAVWIAPAVFAAIGQVVHNRLDGEAPASVRDLLWAGGDWLVYALVTPLVFWVAGRWPLARPHLWRRGLLHFGFALVFCVAWAVLGKLLQLGLAFTFQRQQAQAAIAAQGDRLWQTVEIDVLHWIFATLPFGVIVYLCVAGLAHAIQYFVEAGERDVQLARLSEQLSGARLAALQARLNPHFLFNTLNTIAVRARDGDGAGTARMVEQLSDVLRRTLNRRQVNEVPLDDELELVRQYLAIEQARFPDRLRPSFEIDEGVGAAAVPTFALQHLVENAIRHGIARRSAAGIVRVSARRRDAFLELAVMDDGPGLLPDVTIASGHGIETTRERLRALHGDRASLDVANRPEGGVVATLRVPYHEIAVEADVAER